jgi:arylsulfatase A-like enzyme
VRRPLLHHTGPYAEGITQRGGNAFSRGTWRVAAVLLSVLSLSCAARRPPGNVILILCDTVRADHLGLYGYGRATTPFLDTVAQRSLVYNRAYSHFSYTWPTISNLFTGLPYSKLIADKLFVTPKVNDEPGLVPAAETLAERLGAAGVETLAVSANPYITTSTGFAQGFDVFHDVYSWDAGFWKHKIRKFTAHEVNEVAYQLLDGALKGAGSGRPFFLYLHYFDPHMPYVAPPQQRALFQSPGYDREGRVVDGYFRRPDGKYLSYLTDDVRSWVSPADIDYLEAQYDAELRYFDGEMRELFAFLAKRGLLENTTVILTADHGEAFMDRGFWGHGFLSRSEEEHVPLVVVPPGGTTVTGHRVDGLVTTTDIFYSVLHHFQAPTKVEGGVPWIMEVLSGKRLATTAYSEGPGNTRILRTPRYALYRYLTIEATKRPIPTHDGDFLFDLQDDPGERVNLLGTDPPLGARLRRQLLTAWGRGFGSGSPMEEEPMRSADPETLRRLRALGYVN